MASSSRKVPPLTQRPAGDHQHAAVAPRLGSGEKCRQPLMGLGLGQAVQVEARVDRVVAAPQLEPGAAVEIDRPRRVESARGDPRGRGAGMAGAAVAATGWAPADAGGGRTAGAAPSPRPAGRAAAPCRARCGAIRISSSGVTQRDRLFTLLLPAAQSGSRATIRISSRRGPCAPSSSFWAMSAVRDGPVTKFTERGTPPGIARTNSQASS